MSQGLLQFVLVGTLCVAVYLLFIDVRDQRHEPYAVCPAIPPPPQCKPKPRKRCSSECGRYREEPPESPIYVSVREKPKPHECRPKVEQPKKNKKLSMKNKKRRRLSSSSPKPKEKPAQRQKKKAPEVKEKTVTQVVKMEEGPNFASVAESIVYLRTKLQSAKIKMGELSWFNRDTDYFYVSASSMSWDDAKLHCELMHAGLVSDKFATEQNYRFLQTNVFPNYRGATLWSGLRYSNHTWRWSDGKLEVRDKLQPLGARELSDANQSSCSVVTKLFPALLEAHDCNETRHRAFCYTGQRGYRKWQYFSTKNW